MNIGTVENLKISKIIDIGAYLVDENNNKVLLPKKQMPKGANVDDFVEVFIYKDSKGRLISTTKKPFLTLGNIARLTVKDVNNVGAFLNMGLERDLLLPYSEQTKEVNIGDKVDVIMYLDKSDRLCASMYTNNKESNKRIKNKDIRTLEYEQNAETVYKIIKNNFKGHLVYNDKNADVEQIKKDFNMSKSTFKKSIGKLLKDNKLKITNKGIFLY